MIVIIVVLLSAGTAYAAPKINDYLTVNTAITGARKLQAEGNYGDALALLNSAEGKWTLPSNKQNLENLKGQENSYVQDQNNYNLAVSEEASSTLGSSSLEDAQTLLQSIPSDYPGYEKVLSEISSVQSEIENQLQNQTLQAQDQEQAAEAEKAQADAQAAQARTQAATAAKDKASAEAAAAAAAQAQAEANTQAVAATAAAAAAQADTQHQVQVSFYNQLLSIYKAVSDDGIGYYNNAMNYYNSGSSILALGVFGQAQAVFQKAYDDAVTLNSGFTGLPASYVSASYSMSNAANDCLQATNIMMENIGDNTNMDANSDSADCDDLKSSVETFLSTANP